MFPPDTSPVCSPPGKLGECSSLPLVVVSSFPRSGTHVLIDLILNNFPAYRRKPLYVNLDQYIGAGMDVEELIRIGGYVVKTHFPESTFSSSNRSEYEKVFAKAVILKPMRQDSDIFLSFQSMDSAARLESLERELMGFRNYWQEKDPIRFSFESLIDPDKTGEILAKLQEVLKCPRSKTIVFPPNKNHRIRVYFRKWATRILGNKLGEVNTTVGFRRTSAKETTFGNERVQEPSQQFNS